MRVLSVVGILGSVVIFKTNERANVIGQQKFKSHLQSDACSCCKTKRGAILSFFSAIKKYYLNHAP